MDLSPFIDHTFLKPSGGLDAIEKLCREAATYGFACVMVHPCEVKNAARILKKMKADVRIGTVVGFPLGQNTARIKRLEAEEAISHGARDIDFVINMRLLQAAAQGDEKALNTLQEELELLAGVKEIEDGITTKLILECCYLTDEEKVLGCALARATGFDFVKTSTGFGTPAKGIPAGATVHDVALMRKAVGKNMGVKAAGGIRDCATAQALIDAGANRLGCSTGVEIVR